MTARMLIGGLLCVSLFAAVAPAADAPSASPEKAASALARRVLGDKAALFAFETIPADAGRDVFEFHSAGDKVTIRGNSALSMCVALNWYLKHHAHCDVSWYGSQVNLPDPLPKVDKPVRRVAWARYRYFLNYCCFGYSLPFWDWPQWERLVDWMALNGINVPLSVTGQEAVWQAVCRRLGLSDKQLGDFLAGPPYLSFGWMGCLDGWGGPLPARWNERHAELGQKILDRQRSLGMTPILQGFTGHVPPGVAEKFPQAKLHKIAWIEWKTYLLDPLDPLFARLAAMFMEEQSRLFGSDHLYASDTFIEMTPPSGDTKYLDRLGRAIYDGMVKSDPKAIWVLQGWLFFNNARYWTAPRGKAFLDAVPDDHMLVLDLFCDATPVWNKTEAFWGKPWAWCFIQSFGRTVQLGGSMNRIARDLPALRGNKSAGRLEGLGFVNEGLDYNPPVYDLMFEMAWRDAQPVDLGEWLAGYARRRYGRDNADARAAWGVLHSAVYGGPSTTRSIVTRLPSMNSGGVSPGLDARLARAWQLLERAGDDSAVAAQETYRYDLVNLARQVIANRSPALHRDIAAAFREKDLAAFEAASKRFLDLLADLDELLATREEFLLGCWLEDAKRWGDNDAERAKMEWNARRVLTLWGARSPRDYARKEWAGMIRDFYAHRWAWYLGEQAQALKTGKPLDEKDFARRLLEWETKWSDRHESFATRPAGDSLALARRLREKYAQAGKPNAVSLTTNKPVTCSHSLPPHPADLANDGWIDTESFWATDVAQTGQEKPWWQVDLGQPTTVGRVVVVGYFGDKRHYGFTVETSTDARTWETVADRRDSKEPATAEGYVCRFAPRAVRYIRVTQTLNSANTGRHLVEVMAFEK